MSAAILIVEDDLVNRDFLNYFLSNHGYEVTAVSTGEEGLKELELKRYQLLILDLMLPGKNGGEVAWAARSRGCRLPILAISGALEAWETSDLEDLGITRALSKPFSNDELIEQVRQLIGAR
jgi:DNA-binding response OmpR family regulator